MYDSHVFVMLALLFAGGAVQSAGVHWLHVGRLVHGLDDNDMAVSALRDHARLHGLPDDDGGLRE